MEFGLKWGPSDNHTQPRTNPHQIDSRIGGAAPRAPAASMEDSRPQAIVKFNRLSSLDYRVRHQLLVGKDVSRNIILVLRDEEILLILLHGGCRPTGRVSKDKDEVI